MNIQIYRTIIADDEQLARARLKNILAEFPEIEIIAEASDGLEALALINRMKPDLLFLDIQMPGLTGFELLKKATHFPIVIYFVQRMMIMRFRLSKRTQLITL